MELLLADIALIIIVGSIFGLIARLLRQPLLIGYIIAGLLIGPFGLNHISNEATILSISELGITFLLFVVGIELNVNRIREVGKVVFLGGIMQIVICAIITLFISLVFKFNFMTSFYLGLVLAFSSTLVGVKYLAEKKEIESPSGRIVVGILVFQDLIAILVVSILPTVSSFNLQKMFISGMSGVIFLVLSYLIFRLVIRRIFDLTSKNEELLFLSSLGVCFAFAFFAQLMGFSLTIGAFLAGIMIANLPYYLDIIGKVKSLSTFFTVLFFVALGMQINLRTVMLVLPIIILYFLIAILVKPFVVYMLVRKFGYGQKISFISALSLGQISEFSLIIISLGISLKHVSQDILSLVISITVISMAVSTYLLNNDLRLLARWQKTLSFIDRILRAKGSCGQENSANEKKEADIIINGYEHVGQILTDKLLKTGKKFLVVDNDAELIQSLKEKKVIAMFGNIEDQEILERINLDNAKLVISAHDDLHANLTLLRNARSVNKTALIVVSSSRIDESLELYNEGADYVIIPQIESEKRIASIIEEFSNDSYKHAQNKIQHIEHLRNTLLLHQNIKKGNVSFIKEVESIYADLDKAIKEKKP